MPLLTLFLSLAIPAVCAAQPQQRREPVAGAKVLNDQQMDFVTAASVGLTLNLSATATGPTAVTSTQGAVQTGRTTILLVSVDPQAPAAGQVRLLGSSLADLLFGSGQAEARGASDAHCSASLDPIGTLAFFTQANTTVTATNLAICSCAAFGIGLVGP